MTTPIATAKPTEMTVNFFEVEIRNEDDGGVSPATLGSALDSFVHAPDDVLSDWFGIDVTAVTRPVLHAEIDALIAALGADFCLDEFDDVTERSS